MAQTAEFYQQAEATIFSVLQEYRPTLLASFGNVEAEIKEDSSPVTALDKELEQILGAALLELDVGIGIVGEEFGQDGNTNTYWLIDPIDQTENFVRGLPTVRNMITLVENKKPVFALVYNPITDQLITAREGGGTFLNHQKVQVSNRPIGRAIIELSVPPKSDTAIKLVQAMMPYVNGFRITADFAQVATGKIDGHVVYGSSGGPWDYAPRAILIAEAGGRVANIGSDTYSVDNHNLLASNPVIFEKLKTITDEIVANA